jgi:hypothetical protein
MKIVKIVSALALIVGIVSMLQYIIKTDTDSLRLIGRDYSYKQDYIEQDYNGYLVYRYYSWLNTTLPKDKLYGLLVSKDDTKSYGRYLHKMDYFLYPRYIDDKSDVLFAPKLSSLKLMASKGGFKYVVKDEKNYYLTSVKDDTGVFIKQ